MTAVCHSRSEKLPSIPEVYVCGGSCVEYRTEQKSGLISDTTGRSVCSGPQMWNQSTQHQEKEAGRDVGTAITKRTNYKLALGVLKRLLEQGMLTPEQFKKADELTARKYKPFYRVA